MTEKEELDLYIEVGKEYGISDEKFTEIMPFLIKVTKFEPKVRIRRKLVQLRRYYTALTGIENPHLQ